MRSPFWLSSPAALAYCAFAIYLHKSIGEPPGGPAVAALLAQYLFLASAGLWIVLDAHQSGWPLPYDYASFVFIIWPVFALIYLFSAHGRRAFSPIICAVCLVLGGGIVAEIAKTIASLYFQ